MPPKRKRAVNTNTTDVSNSSTTTTAAAQNIMGAKQSSGAATPSTSNSTPSKRKRSNAQSAATPNNTLTVPSSLSVASSNGSSSKKGSVKSRKEDHKFNMARCNAWFDEFRDADNVDIIGSDGIERFCAEIDLTLENILVLVIAWKLEAATMGYFTRSEWTVGMKKLEVDSAQKLRTKLPELERSWKEPDNFKELYRYSFGFAKNKDQKCMDLDTAKPMWQLLLGNRFAHSEAFLQFLEEKKPVKVINKDQWLSFLEFSTTVAEDLSNYDDMSAWPVLFDEYVEWRREKGGGEENNEY